ncbi:MAG: hypothetical protein AMK71_07670 [Nitrospira bacterium SG8_35_4]|nr:MAG: hypothetical protein AMK71_07670 [Nitrospira bacterium SG8_35_4]
MNRKAETIRIRYLYRDMILKKRIKLSFEASLKIVGPDCAYHLYALTNITAPHKASKDKGR